MKVTKSLLFLWLVGYFSSTATSIEVNFNNDRFIKKFRSCNEKMNVLLPKSLNMLELVSDSNKRNHQCWFYCYYYATGLLDSHGNLVLSKAYDFIATSLNGRQMELTKQMRQMNEMYKIDINKEESNVTEKKEMKKKKTNKRRKETEDSDELANTNNSKVSEESEESDESIESQERQKDIILKRTINERLDRCKNREVLGDKCQFAMDNVHCLRSSRLPIDIMQFVRED